jgi:hypothetical protein
MTNEQKRSRHDQLISTTKEGKIELTEQELSRVAGGGIVVEYLKSFDASMKIG